MFDISGFSGETTASNVAFMIFYTWRSKKFFKPCNKERFEVTSPTFKTVLKGFREIPDLKKRLYLGTYFGINSSTIAIEFGIGFPVVWIYC